MIHLSELQDFDYLLSVLLERRALLLLTKRSKYNQRTAIEMKLTVKRFFNRRQSLYKQPLYKESTRIRSRTLRNLCY